MTQSTRSKNCAPVVSFALSAAAALVASCAVDAGDEDGQDEDFLVDGKTDSAIVEGSPEAFGVLRVVNEVSRDQLVEEVGLSVRTANQIQNHRAGADGLWVSEDDNRFETLAELDGVPWVGPVSFAKLLAFAQERGFVIARPAACTERTGGAQIEFRIAQRHSFRVWISDEDFIVEAERLAGQGIQRVPMFLQVLPNPDCDAQYNFHVDPVNVRWADVATEVCDGTPDYVSDNLNEWLDTVGGYCPWSAEVLWVARAPS